MGKFGSIFDGEKKQASKRTSKRKSDSAPNAGNESKSNRGRPAGHAGGKRSNPEFKQSLAYVRKETHRAVMKRIDVENDKLSDAAAKPDYSDLVQSLLERWLNS